MLLAIDIGNSSINMGIFEKQGLLGRLNIPSRPRKTREIYRNRIKAFLEKNSIEMPLKGVIISSVVRELTGTLSNSVKELTRGRPVIMNTSLKTGLILDVEKPEELGSDRISNVVAAREFFGSPVVVVDFGTATSVSAVMGRRFIGGAILPGMGLMSESLYTATSRLPHVDIWDAPEGLLMPAVGKNTAKCIISGIIYGTAGAAERLISEIEKEEGCRFKVVITGGHSSRITRFLRRKHYMDSDLTLRGLRLIYERNVRCMS